MPPVDRMIRATARAESRHFWFRGFRYFVTPLLRDAIAGRKNPRILDCGCGTGSNLALLGQFGRAFGFDLNPLGLRIGREAGRRGLALASVAAAPFPDNAFDLVTSFDVLYCLPAPVERAAVAEMYRVTRPGGVAVVNVAAMEMLRGDHSVLVHEVRRYSRRTLGDLLTSSGFRVVRMTYTNAILFPIVAASRFLQRTRGLRREEEAGGDMAIPPGPVNAALTGALWLESLWLRAFDLPFGSSLLAVVRKPA
jgi:SAM-dependent methyltransferase